MSQQGARYRLALALGIVLLVSLFVATPIHAQSPSPDTGVYVVQPGDTLPAIADRFGLSLNLLIQLNGIRHPRDLYVGQRLYLGDQSRNVRHYHILDANLSLSNLCRALDLSPIEVALDNGLLLPTGLGLGQVIGLPQAPPVAMVSVQGADYVNGAPRLAAAVVEGVDWWAVQRLNPLPVLAGFSVLLPVGSSGVRRGNPPELVSTLVVSQQPVTQGRTLAFHIKTQAPVSCTVSALGASEPCWSVDAEGRGWQGIIGFSPILAPGVYTLTLALTESGTTTTTLVPLRTLVSAGRYDFERLDLPQDRQVLLDPQLSQDERNKIAALKLLRTPERMWSYPFLRPIETQVSSYFGSRRSYGYGFDSFHAGTDFDGQIGMAVKTPADGIVILAEPLVVRGNAILIDHGQGVVTGFWHLSRFYVAVGERVVAGQEVAALGNTGLSTGPHLHWELWVNGSPVDALEWLEPDGPASLLEEQTP